MSGGALVWRLAKALQAVGLIAVLVGLLLSVDAGMRDESLESQRMELLGLMLGGGVFVAGWVLERAVGGR